MRASANWERAHLTKARSHVERAYYLGAVMIRYSMLVLVLVTACKGREEDSQLQRLVRNHCHDLSSRLRRATEKYGEFASALDSGQLSPEQRARVESTLQLDAIGASDETRVAKMFAIHDHFYFCMSVKRLDDKHQADIGDRVAVLVQTLREQCFDSNGCTVMPHEEALKHLKELAGVANELDALPLVK